MDPVAKRNLQLLIVGGGGLLIGFLVGQQVRPREPGHAGRVVHVPIEIYPPEAERLPPKAPASGATAPAEPATPTPPPAPVVQKDGAKAARAAAQPDGVWTTRHPGGQVKSQGEYRNGKAEGVWRYYYENGNASSELRFENGKLEGPAVYWHQNGAIMLRGEYRNGVKHGLWTTWDADGNVTREEDYRNGSLTAPVRLFDPKGEFPPEAEALAKAEVNGKYRNLLTKVAAPDDRASYTKFRDYGWYAGTSYKGRYDLPQGYWVYVYPYWYIFGECTQKDPRQK